MRVTLDDPIITNPLFETGLKSRVMIDAITDNYQLTNKHPLFMWLDPNGGHKDVRLPLATDAESAGRLFFIINAADAAENLVVKNTGETETVVTIGQGNIGIVFCDGASVTGWIGAVFDQTVAGSLASLAISGALTVGTTADFVDVNVGASGTAGVFDVFPATGSKGKLNVSVTDQTGNTTVSLVIGAMAAARTITVRDPGAAASVLTTTDATAAAIAATAVEIARACDTSARLVSVGGTALTITEALHDGKIVKLDHTAAPSTCTLPLATGSGSVFRFIVTAINTNNHLIKVASAAGTISGSVNILDADAAAQTAYSTAATTDTITLNGTTTGGQVGDMIELVDIATDKWAIRGQLVCPAGSNIATPFSATVA
jgi:hypothetical protein